MEIDSMEFFPKFHNCITEEVPWSFHGVLWTCHRVSMEFYGDSMEIPWSFHEGAMEVPWSFHGVLWTFHGVSMEFHGDSMEFYGDAMEFPWSFMEVP